jgi:two-component system, response regulator PdtaR
MTTPIKVLVVEDEPFISMDISEHLQDVGFIVFEASNADAAITLLEENSDISLIFTDIDMPGSMDGLKLAAAVADRWPPIRIIITSGHRTVEITDIPDGSVFFAKPYSNRTIETAVRDLLR